MPVLDRLSVRGIPARFLIIPGQDPPTTACFEVQRIGRGEKGPHPHTFSLLGVPKPGCFKPGCLQFLRSSAHLRSFAPFCVFLRPTAFRTTAFRTTAFGDCSALLRRYPVLLQTDFVLPKNPQPLYKKTPPCLFYRKIALRKGSLGP